jgi:hypothetical protein
MPGLRYLFPFSVRDRIVFPCLDKEMKPTGRSMCILVAGVNAIEDCEAFQQETIPFPFPPNLFSLGPGWWSVSIYCDDTVPDDLFEMRLKSAIELLQRKAELYMQNSGFDEHWRCERDGVVWRVALEEDVDELLRVHKEAHPHVNGRAHPHPLRPPVVLALVAEKEGKIIGGCYVEAVADVSSIGTNAEAFATLPALDHDVRALLEHRAFRIIQTRVIPEAAAAMEPVHAALGFERDPNVVLWQKV